MNITGHASITDYNTIQVYADLDLTNEDPSLVFYTYVFANHYYPPTGFAQYQSETVDPNNPSLFHKLFELDSCYFDTLYYYDIKVTNVPFEEGQPFPTVVGSYSGTIRTQPCPSSITNYNVIPYQHKAYFEVTANILTNDNYKIQVWISTNQNFIGSKATEIPYATSWNGTYFTGKYKLLGLLQNKKYYLRISLICTSTSPSEQIVDQVSGDFHTLKDGFPLWMYLRYHI